MVWKVDTDVSDEMLHMLHCVVSAHSKASEASDELTLDQRPSISDEVLVKSWKGTHNVSIELN